VDCRLFGDSTLAKKEKEKKKISHPSMYSRPLFLCCLPLYIYFISVSVPFSLYLHPSHLEVNALHKDGRFWFACEEANGARPGDVRVPFLLCASEQHVLLLQQFLLSAWGAVLYYSV
jgi:hypothetical protein